MSCDAAEARAACKLCDFIRSHQSEIIADWSDRVRSLSPAHQLSERVLVDHLPEIVARVADIVETAHTGGDASLEEIPKEHAVDRLQRGFNVDQVIVEYSLLRRAILDSWDARVGGAIPVTELRNFDSAFDEAITQSTVRYAQAREKLLRALDRVSESALASADLDPFLDRLLQVVLEGTEAADSCIIFLREGDRLHARAAAGLEQELVRGYSLEIGESFAGRVAQQRRPLALRHASEDPMVKSPVIRGSGIQALYGVPMFRGGEVIGVAHVGSRSAFEFSDEDKLLFRTVVSRATAAIVKAQVFTELARSEAAHRFLSDAGHEFGKLLDFDATLVKIAYSAVPTIADWCVVDRREGDRIRRVAAAHSDPAKVSIAQELGDRYAADPRAQTAIAEVFRTGRTAWSAEISEADLTAAAFDSEYLEMLRAVGLTSYIIVPVTLSGEVDCTITLVTAESGRRYTETDVRVAEQLADRAAAALENSRLYAAAQQAISAREKVLAIVAHDLRNQLMIMGTDAALLAQKADSVGVTGGRKRAERIVHTIGTMRHMLDDLLDVGAIDAGKLSFNPEPVAVSDILNEAYAAHLPAAQEKGLELKLEPAASDMHVRADRRRVMQVLSNLLGNAIKFTPHGGTVTLAAHAEEAQVQFSVSDTGPGISKSDLVNLFEPYSIVDQRARSGSGLGLYIAKGIVVQHGGRIWASSEIGRGSAFCFTLTRAG